MRDCGKGRDLLGSVNVRGFTAREMQGRCVCLLRRVSPAAAMTCQPITIVRSARVRASRRSSSAQRTRVRVAVCSACHVQNAACSRRERACRMERAAPARRASRTAACMRHVTSTRRASRPCACARGCCAASRAAPRRASAALASCDVECRVASVTEAHRAAI